MFDVTLLDRFLTGIGIAVSFWWAYVPIVLIVGTYQFWMIYQQQKYILEMKWVMLEVVPPPDVPKSPKLAESIFAGLHAIYLTSLPWKKMFFTGAIPDFFSFETVSHGGEIHFFIRTPEKLRDLVESNIFAQYPDAEIKIVDDYIDLLPEKLADEHSMFGMEMQFTKDPAFPIKTWREFEEAGGKDEHQRIDPIAPLLETMSAMRPGEYLWIQYLIRPTGGDWIKAGKNVVDELMGKEKKEKLDPLLSFIGFLGGLLGQLLGTVVDMGESEEKKKDDEKFTLMRLTPSQKKVLESVEDKLSKPAFKVGFRFVYVGQKEVFNMSRVSGLTGMYKQLYNNNMNTFRPNRDTMTFDRGALSWLFANDQGFFAKARANAKKRNMYEFYRMRAQPEKEVILNIEELATLWHLPGINVQAPLLPRVQAKKGQPPAFLPVK